jgi:hypothetical protein
LSFFDFLSYRQEKRLIRGAERVKGRAQEKGRNTKPPSKLQKEACMK